MSKKTKSYNQISYAELTRRIYASYIIGKINFNDVQLLTKDYPILSKRFAKKFHRDYVKLLNHLKNYN